MFKSLVLPSLMLLIPVAAHAEKGNDACRADIERLCPDAGKDRKAVRACLTENAASLSAECTAKTKKKAKAKNKSSAKRAAAKAKMEAACGADIQQFCAGTTGKATAQCLQKNSAAISAECKAVAGAKKKRRGARKAAKSGE